MSHLRQQKEGWGNGLIPRLSKDIRNELPEVKGFSQRNIGYMIRFAREYDSLELLQQPAAKTVNGTSSTNLPQAVAQLILCQTKDRILAEYALRDIHKPTGISDYELTRALPDKLKSSLPSIEEIEAELSGGGAANENE